MYNFMGCNQMMFGSKVKYGITYKTNQRSFDVYRRKYIHNFKVPVVDTNLEGSFGIDLTSINAFCVTQIDKIFLYDSNTFQQVGQLPIELLKTTTREPNQIISIRKSHDDQFIACISGKNLIMKQQKANQLFIFQKKRSIGKDAKPEFEQVKRIIIKDMPIFDKVCMQFYFKNPENGKTNRIFFVKSTCIIELNFETERTTEVYSFKTPLNR